MSNELNPLAAVPVPDVLVGRDDPPPHEQPVHWMPLTVEGAGDWAVRCANGICTVPRPTVPVTELVLGSSTAPTTLVPQGTSVAMAGLMGAKQVRSVAA